MTRRHRHRLLAAAAGVVLVAGAAIVAVERAGPDDIRVRVGHEARTVPAGATVGTALRRARAHPSDGVLRAAVSGRVIDAHHDPARILLDGRITDRHRGLRDRDRIEVINGLNAVETTVEGRVAIPAPGLPSIERELWLPGTDGVADQQVGALSGEIASNTVVVQPTSAVRMPGNVVALTFDDGPDPRYTPQVLAILQRAGVKAAFCVIGHRARLHPELVRAIVSQGHLLCDHTESHPFLDRVAPSEVASQIAGPAEYCQLSLGIRLRFLRPPYGATNAGVLDTAHQQGLRVLEWSVDPRDFDRPLPAEITRRVLSRVRPGRIVLMHDGGGDRSNTVAALDPIITFLKAQGYTFAQPASA